MDTQTFSFVAHELTLDQVKANVPSAFTDHSRPGLSSKYVHLATSTVIEDLIKLGWKPVKAQEIRARKNVGYQKHLVVFRNENVMIKGTDGDDAYPQILMTNSHDGKAAFNFRVGIFRLVCSNGLVVSDADFSNVSIRHFGYTFEVLQEKINEVINKLPGLVNKINTFTQKELTETQMQEFAARAVKLRLGENSNVVVDPNGLLAVTRTQDSGNSLWAVFNRIQEKILDGDFTYSTGRRARARKARSIKNFQQDIKLNEQLFELAESYV
jgi:hypothetical protein